MEKNTVLKYDVAVKYMPTEDITLHLIAHKDNIKMYDVMNHYKSCFKSLGNHLIPQYMNSSIYLGKNINSFIKDIIDTKENVFVIDFKNKDYFWLNEIEYETLV